MGVKNIHHGMPFGGSRWYGSGNGNGGGCSRGFCYGRGGGVGSGFFRGKGQGLKATGSSDGSGEAQRSVARDGYISLYPQLVEVGGY